MSDPIRYPPPGDTPIPLEAIARLADFEAPARDRLDPAVWSYDAGGAWDERTLRDNLASWDRYRLRPRALVDVETLDLRTTLFGSEVAAPFGIAPAALHGLAHLDGECATARAAAAAGGCACPRDRPISSRPVVRSVPSRPTVSLERARPPASDSGVTGKRRPGRATSRARM